MPELTFLDRVPRWVDGVVSFVVFMACVFSGTGPFISIPVLVVLNLLFDGIRKYHDRTRSRNRRTPTAAA